MLTQTIRLSAKKLGVQPCVEMMQGDTGRVLQMTFADFEVPSGATAEVYIHRPNGTYYTVPATVAEQAVTCEADQICTTYGFVYCNLQIAKDGEAVQSFPFTVRVIATAAGSPQTTEQGVSVADLDERVTYLEEHPAGGVWGEITGTLADQTDLKNALDGKLPMSSHGDNYEYIFDDRVQFNGTDDSILMKSGDTGVGANLRLEDGEITIGDDINVIRAREGYAADLGVKSGDTWTYSPIATEAYVAEHGGISQADADNRYLQLSGGTMTGNLDISNKRIEGNGYTILTQSSTDYYIGNKYRRLVFMTSAASGNFQHNENGSYYDILDSGNTSANPTLSGGETTLSSLKLNGTNYAVGGGSLYAHHCTLRPGTSEADANTSFINVVLTTASSTALTRDQFRALTSYSDGTSTRWIPCSGVIRSGTTYYMVTGFYSGSAGNTLYWEYWGTNESGIWRSTTGSVTKWARFEDNVMAL